MTGYNLWILHKTQCKRIVFCFPLLWREVSNLKCLGKILAALYVTPFWSQGSKETIWNSSILIFSLLFSTLIESFDCKERIDSEAPNFLPAWWFSPTMSAFCLQTKIISLLLDPVNMHHLGEDASALRIPNLPALKCFAFWGSSVLTTKPVSLKAFTRQRLQTGSFKIKSLSQIPGILLDSHNVLFCFVLFWPTF